ARIVESQRGAVVQVVDVQRSFAAAAHAGRARRHAGDGETAGGRLLAQEPLDALRRDVPLEGVPADARAVTAGEPDRNAGLALQLGQPVRVDDVDVEAVRAQVLRIFLTAAAGRALVD